MRGVGRSGKTFYACLDLQGMGDLAEYEPDDTWRLNDVETLNRRFVDYVN